MVRTRSRSSAEKSGGLAGAFMQPVTQYAKSGDVHIAYQAFGNGPINLVMVPGFVSNVENYWDQPDFARFLNRLGSYARVVTFDKRGTGMSDRVAELPGLDQRMDDLRAVMDAAGMENASLLGISEGAPLSVMFAASYPERCRALVLYGSFSRFSYWFPTEEALEAFFSYVSEAWGTGRCLQRCSSPTSSAPPRKLLRSAINDGGICSNNITLRSDETSHDFAATKSKRLAMAFSPPSMVRPVPYAAHTH